MFKRLAQQHRAFVQDLVLNLQALAIVLEKRGYLASCYTCGKEMHSASFMVSFGDSHLIRFLVSDYGITWTEMRDDRELMKLEGAEAISQLQELADMLKYDAYQGKGEANIDYRAETLQDLQTISLAP